ncbi:hypothetical protein [Paenibacillus sp. NPDC058177]|uniref:hypothetical protein n=1 Tax=Paenibacillus sp. NPDC058177 TaxID=3346369 RepID=UPI0036DB0543
MSYFGIQLPVVILAIITAFVGYQFNYRAKKKETYLKELSQSYHEVYSPMFIRLKKIVDEKEQSKKNNLLADFFNYYQQNESKIRFIGSSFNLEAYFKLELSYFENLNNPGRVSEKALFDSLNGFYVSIENEFWEAHDTIYEDHLQFRSLNKKNIFFRLIIELFILMHNLSTFIFSLTGLYLYASVWNEYIQKIPSEEISQWLNVPFSIFTVLMSIVLYSFTKMLYVSVKKENKRSNSSMKRIFRKIRSKFHFCNS